MQELTQANEIVNALPSLSHWEMVGRIFLTIILCGAIGLEREIRGQVAGMRTHVLVGVGSALFTMISAFAFSSFVVVNPDGGFITTVDPTRIAAQIIAGIGFLGAGAILRQGLTVRGLTTAAALWIDAAIGMAIGAGFYLGGIITTLAVLLTLIGLRKIRPFLTSRWRSELHFLDISLEDDKHFHKAMGILAKNSIDIESITSEKTDEKLNIRIELRAPEGTNLPDIVEEISELKSVDSTTLHKTSRTLM